MKALMLCVLLLSPTSLLSQTTKPLPTVSGLDDSLSPNLKKLQTEALNDLSKPDLRALATLRERLQEPAKSPVTEGKSVGQPPGNVSSAAKRIIVTPIDSQEDWEKLIPKSALRSDLSQHGKSDSNPFASPSPSPQARFSDRDLKDFLLLERSATIKPARPLLNSSMPGVHLDDKLATDSQRKPTPASNQRDSSWVYLHRDRLIAAAGGGAGATGWQLYKLRTNTTAATDMTNYWRLLDFLRSVLKKR
jgi:hypothetical protein